MAVGVALGLAVAIPAMARANRQYRSWANSTDERAQTFREGYELGLKHGHDGQVVSMAGAKRDS
jgi:hypothetical protein